MQVEFVGASSDCAVHCVVIKWGCRTWKMKRENKIIVLERVDADVITASIKISPMSSQSQLEVSLGVGGEKK